MHADDLPATALVQPASRVTWRLAVAAPQPDAPQAQAAVRGYMAWATATIEQQRLRGVRVDSLESGRPETQQTLQRAEQFLKLVALLAALLALLEALLADLEALLEALLMLLETLLETELAEEEAEEEADEAADEPEPVKLLMREPGMRY